MPNHRRKRNLKESWTDTAKDIINRFARHLSHIIPEWAITPEAMSRLNTFVSKISTPNQAIQFVNGIVRKMLESLFFDKDARLYLKAIKVNVEFLACRQNGLSAAPFFIDDITETDSRYLRVLELDNDLDYIMLDRNDRACAFVQKPGPELLAKITQHEAEAFMFKHGLRADMESMRLDMRKDYGALMDGVAREAASLGLRL